MTTEKELELFGYLSGYGSLVHDLKPLLPPIVNLNGATAESLIRQLVDVSVALQVLDAAMSQANPHGRDYQTVGESVAMAARVAWEQRRQMLKLLEKEIETVALAIKAQGRR